MMNESRVKRRSPVFFFVRYALKKTKQMMPMVIDMTEEKPTLVPAIASPAPPLDAVKISMVLKNFTSVITWILMSAACMRVNTLSVT
jgi:hypothetical protein